MPYRFLVIRYQEVNEAQIHVYGLPLFCPLPLFVCRSAAMSMLQLLAEQKSLAIFVPLDFVDY